MKKKFVVLILAVIATIACAFGIVGCKTMPNENTGNQNGSGNTDDGNPSSQDSLAYTLNNDNQSYSCSGIGNVTDDNIVIATEYLGKPVTSIGKEAFANCKNLTSVTIPDSVIGIGNGAFGDCTSLTTIVIPKSVTYIGGYAFRRCNKIMSITLPDSIESIGDGVFMDCESLTGIIIPNGVTSIGRSLFYGCENLKDVTIPEGVTVIGESAFGYCNSLESITLPDSVTTMGYGVFSYCNSLKSISIPDGVIDLEWFMFEHCVGLERVILPDGMKSIGDNAFRECISLISITIPESVESIGGLAFAYCENLNTVNWNATNCKESGSNSSWIFDSCINLSNLNIADNVTTIPNYAFYSCDSLTSVVIPKSVMSIGSHSFSGCAALTIYAERLECPRGWDIRNVVWNCLNNDKTEDGFAYTVIDGIRYALKDGVATLANQPRNCVTANISDKVTYKNKTYKVTRIENSAFEYCSELTSITIPDSIMYIGSHAFLDCGNLASITVEDGNPNYHCEGNCLIETASKKLILGCKSSVIPTDGSVTSIGELAFHGCSGLSEIDIPSSVTTIGHNAFACCDDLINVSIPDGVTSIDTNAFGSCRNLENVTLPNSLIDIDSSAFSECRNLQYNEYDNGLYLGNDNNPFLLLVKAKSRDIDSCIINDKTKIIADFAFSGCNNLTSVTLGNDLTYIGELPECSLYTEYDNGLYCGSTDNPYLMLVKAKSDNITSFIIHSRTKIINFHAFMDCKNLESIIIPDGVMSIENYAFSNCSGLTSITIPDSVTSIGGRAFSGCSGLTGITIPDGVTSIGSGAFYGCSGLTGITIGNNVTEIFNEAFRGCSSLKSIVIPASVTNINGDAFKGCTSLASITVDDGNTAYSSYNGILYNKSKTSFAHIPQSISGNVTIPKTVESIDDEAFKDRDSLQSVVISEGVVSIGNSAFSGCMNLISMIIPDSVKSIGYRAFNSCYDLQCNSYNNGLYLGNSKNPYLVFIRTNSLNITSCIINSNTRIIYDEAFRMCAEIESITIPNSVTSIGRYVFDGCERLGMITVGSANTVYHSVDNCLIETESKTLIYGCKNSVIPTDGSVTSIGNSAFTGCFYLNSITIPDGVRGIGSNAFYDCRNLNSITLSDSVMFIGSSAFYGCKSLTGLTMGSEMIIIGDGAFTDCEKLKNLDISSSVKSIGERAFDGCKNLEKITVDSANTIYHSTDNCLIETQRKWLILGCKNSVIPSDGSVTRIGDYAFEDCVGLTEITIPNKVYYIGQFVFSGCSNLKSVTISESVTDIGSDAFHDCTQLKTVYFNAIECIRVGGYYSPIFENCTNLTTAIIGDNVTIIPEYAFDGCSSLTNLIIGKSVTCVGGCAFDDCSNITKIYYKGTAEDWENITIGGSNNAIINATHYYYTETEPALNADGTAYDGNYWHYDIDGVTPVVWTKEVIA